MYSLIAFIIPATAFADDLKTEQPTPIVINVPRPSGKGHLVPAFCTVKCVYANGTLTFSGVEDYGTMAVTVTHEETGTTWSDFIDEDNPTITTGTYPGFYTISIQAANGTELCGSYQL